MAKLQCYLSILLILSSGTFTKLEASYPKKQQENDSTELRLISTVFRHGDRQLDINNGETYPTDPNKNHDSYPDGNGQLTNLGKKRVYEFGKFLRERYNSFLGDIYYQPNVYARSTSFPRTKMTLELVLAGLYPPSHIQQWNPHLAWQPVDILYTFMLNDGLLFSMACPKYRQKLEEVMQSPEVRAEIKQFDDFMEEMTKYTGKNITDITDLFAIYQTLSTEYYLNLTLPEWTKYVFPYGRLYSATMLMYKIMSYNDEVTRLNGGPLLYRMIQDMKEVINGTLVDRKINLFSAHDVNIVAMLYALGILDDTFPSYSSAVIVELHEKNGQHFVKVLHYLGIPPILVEVQIPGCNILCPFDKFVNLRLATTASAEEDPECPREIPSTSTIEL